jgi:hypothetical protein
MNDDNAPAGKPAARKMDGPDMLLGTNRDQQRVASIRACFSAKISGSTR